MYIEFIKKMCMNITSIVFIVVFLFSSCSPIGYDIDPNQRKFEEISKTFSSFDYYPDNEEINLYVEAYDEEIHLYKIYYALIQPNIFYLNGGVLRKIELSEFIEAINQLIQMYKYSDVYTSIFEPVFGDIDSVHSYTTLKPHQTMLFLTMLLTSHEAIGNLDSSSGSNNLPSGISPLKSINGGSAKFLTGSLLFLGELGYVIAAGGMVAGAGSLCVLVAPVALVAIGGVAIVSGVLMAGGISDIKNGLEDNFKSAKTKGEIVDVYSEYNYTEKTGDQYSRLSDITVDSSNITISAFDHGSVDGDRINLEINGYQIINDLTLSASPGNNFSVSLDYSSINKLKITALNEGSSSPNTATVSFSNVISGNAEQVWNLNTGSEAVLLINVE